MDAPSANWLIHLIAIAVDCFLGDSGRECAMQEKLPSRLELLERVKRLRAYHTKVLLAVIIPGLPLGSLALSALLSHKDAFWTWVWPASAFFIAVVLLPTVIVARKSVFARFGLICPHCSKRITGYAPDPQKGRMERLLATGQCAVCGKKIVSD